MRSFITSLFILAASFSAHLSKADTSTSSYAFGFTCTAKAPQGTKQYVGHGRFLRRAKASALRSCRRAERKTCVIVSCVKSYE